MELQNTIIWHISIFKDLIYLESKKWQNKLCLVIDTTRVLFATWWLFVILLSAFYTANLTAFLTLSKFTLDIEKPEDLYKKNYRWVAPEGGPVYNIIENVRYFFFSFRYLHLFDLFEHRLKINYFVVLWRNSYQQYIYIYYVILWI